MCHMWQMSWQVRSERSKRPEFAGFMAESFSYLWERGATQFELETTAPSGLFVRNPQVSRRFQGNSLVGSGPEGYLGNGGYIYGVLLGDELQVDVLQHPCHAGDPRR